MSREKKSYEGIGNVLKALRIANNYSVSELSNKMGIAATYICDMESNRRTPSLEMLEKYSQSLNISLSTLLYFNEEGQKHQYNHQRLLFDILTKLIEDKPESILD